MEAGARPLYLEAHLGQPAVDPAWSSPFRWCRTSCRSICPSGSSTGRSRATDSSGRAQPRPSWTSRSTCPSIGHVTLFPGVQLERTSMLFALSGVFLVLVIINGLFKFYINTFKGRLGERMLRRIRFELIDRMLRFPPSVFKRVKGAEVASMVKDEVEPLGGFIGDAFVQPALLGGQAVTALIFIVVQNFWLGAIAVGDRRRAGRGDPAHAPPADPARPRAPDHRARARRAASARSSTASPRSTPTTRRTTSAPISRHASAASSRSATTSTSGSSWSSSSTISSPR